jgi:hypothetical protein
LHNRKAGIDSADVMRLTAVPHDIRQIERTVSGALRAGSDVDVSPLIGKGGEDNAVRASTDFRLAGMSIYYYDFPRWL